MIDLTSAPEGATGYYVGPTSISFYNGDKYWHDFYGKWIESVNGEEWRAENVATIQHDWSIYNNTKPLSELTDEQLLLITKHKIVGGSLERYDADNGWLPSNTVVVAANFKYRAKQKSERELFIELALSAAKKHKAECDVTFAEAMFKDGFKAPKVGE